MKNSRIICILGGAGTVGAAVYSVLKESGCHVRIGVRNKVRIEKEHLYTSEDVRLFEIDLDNPNNMKEFCNGADLVIGAIGPSTRYSEKMLHAAMTAGIPFIDPGGMHLRKKFLNTEMPATAIIGAGLFPGLSGWMLRSTVSEDEEKSLIEIVIGGKYNFSKASAIDYAEEIQSGTSGIPMACIRNGNIVPAERGKLSGLPHEISELTLFPYITEEIEEILYDQKLTDVDAYTAAPSGLFAAMNTPAALMEEKNDKQRALIWIRKTCPGGKETIFFDGNDPGILTGKILAVSVHAILHMQNRKGIFSMADYLAGYPLLEELQKIEKFRYEKGRI